MKWLRLMLSLGLTALVFFFLNSPRGLQPPIGKFLNPFAGFWQNNTYRDKLLPNQSIAAIFDSVEVVWDERRVPHIFAANPHDLYFVQGYLEARDRLWQMDFVTRAAAGRLAEILGDNPDIISYDRYRRRIGMVYAAEQSLAEMLKDDRSRLALNAYADGVNAWIDQLEEKDYPLEFKILNYRPERWTPLNSALLLKHMSWDLSGFSREVLRTRTRNILGDSLTRALYFQPPLHSAPVIPPGTKWNFQPLPAPPRPARTFTGIPLAGDHLLPEAGKGSNNWALAGRKTLGGYPILCNDPHLGLSLPSVWYEVQLACEGVNVYGVSLPGAPGVMIGFNEQIAWGVTNAYTDVLDWYQVQFRDDDPWEYFYDGEWRRAHVRTETIKVRGKAALVDSIPITQHGLVVYRQGEKSFDEHIPTGTALRWTGHDPSNELLAFLKINRAGNYAEFEEALKTYQCPGQNFVFAGRDGDIAMIHQGKFPLRWEGQGRFISDGRDPAYTWGKWIPREHLPKALNPPRGFLASANQPPVGEDYPYYLAGKYAGWERSLRINEVLKAGSDFTPQDMMDLQRDNLNLRARTVLPTVIAALKTANLSLAETRDLEILSAWDYRNQPNSVAAAIFDRLWKEIEIAIWEDDLNRPEGRLLQPPADVTLRMLLESEESPFFDNRLTEAKESRVDILARAMESTHQALTAELGALSEAWEWGRARGTDIRHLARIKGLGRLGLISGGGADIVNATQKHQGPSWRMVVELGPQVRARGIYPGGQSGNPGSAHYDHFVDDWLAGRYYELIFLQSPREAHPQLQGTTMFRRTP